MGWSDDVEDAIKTLNSNVEIIKNIIEWKFEKSLDDMLEEMIDTEKGKEFMKEVSNGKSKHTRIKKQED